VSDADHQDANSLRLKSINDAVRTDPQPMQTGAFASHRNRIGRGGIISERANRGAHAILDRRPQ
jgi:hypothetical protein